MSQIICHPEQMLGIFDSPRFAKMALENTEKYKSNDPFPHISFDNFLSPSITKAIVDAFPQPNDIDWVNRNSDYTIKKYQHDETKLSPVIRQMLREFNSRQFILFLETLTGIDNLLPDPYFIGGGAHFGGTGDFLKIHADFNWHHKLQAHRRINVLLYLNEGWQEAWGGALELWDKEMTRAVKSYYPLFNKLVVFSTSEDSNHGHPHPLTCPAGVYRRNLNLYYYTTRRDESEIHAPHFTLYKTEASPFAMEVAQKYRELGQTVE